MKRYSINKRILRTVLEIVIGTVANVIMLLVLSYVLIFTGQLNTYGTDYHISISDSKSASSIKNQMDYSVFDYVLFDSDNGELVSGKYQKQDLQYYKEVFDTGSSVSKGSILFTEYENSDFILVIRRPTMPEFVNRNFRHISYNLVSYLFFIVLELLLISISVIRLLREFTKNFRLIEKISLNMGIPGMDIGHKETEILECNNILLTLYQKDEELTKLLEMEKKDKEDLSFQVAALAHDIKTPLTVLKGNIELLEMTNLDEKQLDFMSSMNHSVGIFEKYFNSMVNYSRLLIEDKNYREDIELAEFLDELSLEYRDIMSSKKINFQIVNESHTRVIKGNRLNLDRALINILSNATRFCSEEGKVVLTISESSNFISFEIWNNGLPFTEESLKDGGKLFYTENKGRNDKHYGIGLSFAQKIAMRHQGQLILSNPQNGGAQVTLLIKKF
ncbi:two-component system, sensor histidine kinase, lantibiotic associated [Streptococcus pasteurianus ATCC 43144]|uniref:histidine kinase n=2 Tax=Streptococcus TaxID=1301 RepID=F5X6X8_STRPX|nr:two-component system, sensor histidine kinase, lantibiotic associated [Streptococcus pasteurianus ATCC 43144]